MKIPDSESLLALFAAQARRAVPTVSDINVFQRSVTGEFLRTLLLFNFFSPFPYTLFVVSLSARRCWAFLMRKQRIAGGKRQKGGREERTARKTRRLPFTSQVTFLQAGQVHRSDWEKQRRRDTDP